MEEDQKKIPLIIGNKEGDDIGSENWKKAAIEEVKKQVWLAGPLISVNLMLFSLQLISIMFVGHLGELSLAGSSMATSFATVTGFSLLMGMSSALDTFCGQSYGAKQYHMLGIHLQRAVIILVVASIPLAIIWANSKSLLIAVGQDHQIATEAGHYALFLIPGLFAYGILYSILRFLQTQNIVFPMMLSTGIATLLHLPICWILVFKSGLGNRGAALATGVSYWINAILLALYVKFSSSCSKTWTGFSSEALHNLPSFVRLSIPSACMVCLEMWSFELMVLLAGLLPNPTLETSALYQICGDTWIIPILSVIPIICCLNTAAVVWMIPFGLSGAVSTRVSNELGAGHPQAAKLAVSVVLFLAISEGIMIGMILILIRNIWGYAYSNEEEVVKYVAVMMPILAISNLLDGIQSVLSGIVRGCGRQKIGAFINLGSYYIVGIPFAVLLAFVLHVGGKGLWLGIICALVVQVASLFILTIKTDWEQEAKTTRERVYEAVIPVESVS